MIPFKLRIIREKNRLYTYVLKVVSYFTSTAPTVYLFHDILEDKSLVKTPFAISRSSFETFLLKKIALGNQPLTYEELSAVILNKKKSRNSFYVSFDDANTSVFTTAYPFLKKHGIPFIIFITKALVGKPNFLTEEEIRILSADPLCTVGSHGLHHKMFRYFSAKEAAYEFSASKQYLEALIGKEVTCFAFPYGRMVECSRENIRVLSANDYDFAFSAVAGTLNERWISGRFFLPRVNVDESMVI